MGQSSFTETGDCWFVSLDNGSGIAQLALAFTPAQPKDTVYYWVGASWAAYSSQAFSKDTITVTITAGTEPRPERPRQPHFRPGPGIPEHPHPFRVGHDFAGPASEPGHVWNAEAPSGGIKLPARQTQKGEEYEKGNHLSGFHSSDWLRLPFSARGPIIL